MEYKKKYNEALERARQFIEHPLQEDSENIVEYIFPELTMSEDEKMKDYIKDVIQAAIIPKKENKQKMIAWLEKQGGHKGTDNGETEFHVGDLVVINETTYQITEISNSHVVLSFNGRECKFGLDVLNNAQKFEPQFKVGDWVILNGIVVKILDKQKYGFVGLDIDGKDFFCNYGHTDSMRLWTIDDAKDGDVLSFNDGHGNDCIELIKSVTDKKIEFWFCLTNGNRYEVFDGITPYTNLVSREGATPATKEQRDLLFKKMKEAGYEWNAEKKELKKIEPKTLDADKVIGWLVANICDYEYYVKRFKQDFEI